MSFKREVKMITLLFMIQYMTGGFYDSFRLFIFFIPVYIGFLYGSLKVYYNRYTIIRFSSYFLWQKKIIGIIFEHAIVGALVLSLDNVFISVNPVGKPLLGALYLQYLLFLFLIGGVLILSTLSYKRGIFVSIIMFLLSMTEITWSRFLITLYDLRGVGGTNIFKSIIYFFLINFIVYVGCLLINKVREINYEYI